MVWIRAKTEPLASGDPWGIGQFRFLRKRGEGGFGRVYLADNEAGDLVAVKVLNRPSDGTERFRKEAERAGAVTAGSSNWPLESRATVGSRYTIQVLDFGVDGENPWLAMPFVDGPSLGELATGRPLPPDQVTNIAFCIATGSSRHSFAEDRPPCSRIRQPPPQLSTNYGGGGAYAGWNVGKRS